MLHLLDIKAKKSSGLNMYRALMLTLVCSPVYCINRISQQSWNGVNFAKAIEGRKLYGRVIKELEVESESFCRLVCVEEQRCKSYNFATTNNDDGKYHCELSDSDRFYGHANFTADGNFKYRGIKVALKRSIS